jgi:hypothetical protein
MVGDHNIVNQDARGDDHSEKKGEASLELGRKSTIHKRGSENHESRKADEHQEELLEFRILEESFELQSRFPLRRDREGKHLCGEVHDLLDHPR